MDEETRKILIAKQSDLNSKFEDVQKNIRFIETQERTLGQKKEEANVELFRLQGEYRLIQELLETPLSEEK